MRLLAHYIRFETIGLARQPQYWVPSLAFPTLFFSFFGITVANAALPQLPPDIGSELFLASFVCFGLLTIMLFQFGVGIAEERRQPWEVTLRVLPAGAAPRFLGRVGTALVFSVGVLVPLITLAALTTTLRLDALEWVRFLGSALLGAVPFGLAGITLGFATTPKAALPIANLAFLLLSFLGGLFVPVDMLPDFVSGIAPYLPTRHYLDLVLGNVTGTDEWVTPALYMLGWTAFFAATSWFVYRRDEGVRYG
jgi:ABC-2 type transport system permease protein